MLNLYDPAVTYAQLNMLDSHDTARALWIAGDDKAALKQCVLFQMTMPGAPNIYYGSEIGMTGADDPYCRAAFPWDEESAWDHDLLANVRAATALRHQHAALRTGSFTALDVPDGCFGFVRALDGQQVVVLFNKTEKHTALNVDLPDGAPQAYRSVWPAGDEQALAANSGHLALTIPARGAVVLAGG